MKVFVLLLFISFKILAAPLGHEAGVLGNSTSRPGDVSSALTFPSAISFNKKGKMDLYSSIMYQNFKIKEEGHSSDFNSSFIPNFSSTVFSFWDIDFSTFVTYSGNLSGIYHLQTEGYNLTADIAYEEIEYGLSISKLIDMNSGWGVSLSINNERTNKFIDGPGTHSSQSSLLSIKDRQKFTLINGRISYSKHVNDLFISYALKMPSFRLSSFGKKTSLVLVNNSTFSNTEKTYRPSKMSSPAILIGVNAKYFDYLIPTLDITYFLKRSGTQISGPETSDVKYLEFMPSLKVDLGIEFEKMNTSFLNMNKYQFLAGISYTQKQKENKNNESNAEVIYYSVGVRLKNSTSEPIIGMFYEHSNDDYKSVAVGVLYSSSYSIF